MAESSGSFSGIPQDVLQDLCSRFLINIPDNEKNDMVRICFQIEQAHWYYIDFCRQEDPDLPPCGMKPFMNIIFSQFDFLNKTGQPVVAIYEEWRKYKIRVPVFGAILLDDTLEKCLLVQGFHNKASWGFPKGKVNKDEEGLKCAIREVWEEVGFDMTSHAKEDDFIENNFHDHQVRLYIVPGVDERFAFKPNTRGEIKEIRWFNVGYLPTHKRDLKPKEIGFAPNHFFMIHPFVKPLRKWIFEKKSQMMNKIPNQLLRDGSSPRRLVSSASPKSEERREQLKNQRKEQAEQFRQMHVLMNPLRTNADNENVLKAILGMKAHPSQQQQQETQPEAIRKLLSGTVHHSPNSKTPPKHSKSTTPTNKPKSKKTQPASYVYQKPSSTEPLGNSNTQASPFAMTGFNILQRDELKSAFHATTPSKKSNAPSPPYVPPSFGGQQPPIQKPVAQKRGNQPALILSDFQFSSPAFMNFRFDRQQILSVL